MSLKRQRLRLFKLDPHCHWCGIRLVYWEKKKGQPPLDSATIDHLRPKHHPQRHEPARDREIRRVLSCWKCNNERDNRERKLLPKEYFYENGGGTPLAFKTLEQLEKIEQTLLRKCPKGGRDKRSVAESLERVRRTIGEKINSSQEQIIKEQNQLQEI